MDLLWVEKLERVRLEVEVLIRLLLQDEGQAVKEALARVRVQLFVMRVLFLVLLLLVVILLLHQLLLQVVLLVQLLHLSS